MIPSFSSILLFLLCITTYAQQPIDVQHYRFEVNLNDGSDAITGKALIDIRFLEDAPVVLLDLVSVKEDKGMYAFLVREGQQVLPSRHVADKIQITLTRPAKKGELRSFEIQYMGSPADGLIISKNKFGDRTFFSDNWPNRARHWIPCHDTPGDKASVEFVVTAPAHYSVVSNGIRTEEKTEGKNRRTHWREMAPLPTKVMAIGVARFAIKNYSDSMSALPVSAWVYPQDSSKGFHDYALAPGIVSFFSGYIAPFPFAKLANVQSKTIFGGMENAGAIFYAENTVTGDRRSEDLIAHEIAHQWFGNTATEKSFPHLWLSEGFATYLTNIYLESRYGQDTLRKRMLSDREQIRSFARISLNPVVDSTSSLMELLNPNSYQKGGWVLHMLRQEVGDTVFQQIIRSYYHLFKNMNADSKDFEAVAEKISGRNLSSFFNTWLYTPGIPEIKIEMQQGQTLQLKVTQGSRLYHFPLYIRIEQEDGTRKEIVLPVKEKENHFVQEGLKGNYKVLVDPDVKSLFRIQQ